MALKRREAAGGGDRQGVGVETCDLGAQFPHLFEWMTELQFEDGSERETPTILLTVGDGRVRLWLNDRAEGVAAWVSGSSLSGALEAADVGLDCGSLEWRRQQPKPRSVGRRST